MTDNPSPDHELPDDISRWPSDPEALLGVTSEVSRRDLRRAYTRMIRRFKPEHFPEEFRRLREAFETLDAKLEWKEAYEQQLAEQQHGMADDTAEKPVSQTMGSPDESPTQEFSIPISESESQKNTDPSISEPKHIPDLEPTQIEADQLWQQVLDGFDPSPIYAQLRVIAEQQKSSDIDYARLYWLLTTHPEFDPERDAIRWLIDGIRQHGLSNRLMPMWLIEVRRRSGRIPEFLDDVMPPRSHDSSKRIDVLQTRWFAARSLSRFDVIQKDLDLLRPDCFDQPDEWQRILCCAVRQLLMTRHPDAQSLLRSVQSEMSQQPTPVDSNWQWDWYEQAMELHQAWSEGKKRLQYTNEYWTEHSALTLERLRILAEQTWEAAPHEGFSLLIRVCSDLDADLGRAMFDLKSVVAISRPLVLRFWEVLNAWISESNDQEFYKATPAVEKLIDQFVRTDLQSNSQRAEIAVAEFCVREAVSPADVAAGIERQADHLHETWLRFAEYLRYHLPLLCIVSAHRLLVAPR